MRIIAGTWKGRRLQTPQGLATRPTPDRVKESLFSIVAGHLLHAQVLDLFAGTGALGLEALSRGASRAVFVEPNASALEALRANVAMASDAVVMPYAYEKALPLLKQQKASFNLVFLDPPYAHKAWGPALQSLHALGLLQQDALVVCEHGPEGLGAVVEKAYHLAQTRSFGDVHVSLFLYTTEKP